MSIEIEYLGWATFRFITKNGTRIVTDPFLEGDKARGIPPCVATAKDLSDTHVVVVTHAAHDHTAQLTELLKASEAKLFCPKDVSMIVLKKGISPDRVYHMAPGVRFETFDIHIKALRSNHISLSEFEGHWLTGVPLSFILDFGNDGKIFFSGDDALGMHFRFIGEIYQPNLAILGIGGVGFKGQYLTELYPDEAVVATKWLNVKAVIPMHYASNEAQEFQEELSKAAPQVELAIMNPGERLLFSKEQGIVK
jgi:L-ascorbate metabolism protein UlaG (beta-lactamase superfamily)